MPNKDEIAKLLDNTERLRQDLLRNNKDLDDLVKVFLKLSIYDIEIASKYIDCPYCQKHMLLEASEISRVLKWIEKEGNVTHRHRLSERLKGLVISLKIFYYVVLGGLRRAGLI